MPKRKLRMGMVGGGRDAFIGAVHRMAANLDGKIELVAGAFSSNPEKSKLSGEDLWLDPTRVYSSYQEMAEKESQLPEDVRIDFVSIVTPNFMHAPVIKCFFEHGFHVVCDKPLCLSLDEAKELKEAHEKANVVFALTHNYTGYPMVKEAREIVKSGGIGKVLKIVAEYPQGWLIKNIEQEDQKQAAWRTDPSKSGGSCCVGDIGTHAENLGRYITGLEIDEMIAEFTTFVDGRELEDDANILVRYKGGAKGILYASQVSAGEENNLNIRIYGTEGSLEWFQEHPNELVKKHQEKPREILRRGNDYLSEHAKKFCRIPAGHQEAFLEAFANIYTEAARAISDAIDGKSSDDYDFPDMDDGIYGMAFIETAIKSSKSDSSWTKFSS